MIDDFCKQLVQRHPASVGRWVLSQIADPPALRPDGSWQVLDRELSSAPLHADSVVLLPEGGSESILHLEFQTRPDALIAERMLEYWIRLHRRFHQPIQQAVIHLKPTSSPLARITELSIGGTRHPFHSLRLWEQDPEPLLSESALLPLAVLAKGRGNQPEQLLSQVRQRLQAISDPDQRRLTTSGCQLLAGLTFSPDVIQRLLAMSILEDSSVYQLIKRKALEEGREEGLEQGREQGRELGRKEGQKEGRREGRQEGRTQGLAEGLAQGRRDEAATLLLRQLQRRCGPLSEQQQTLIRSLALEQLEQLGEAVLDFQGAADLAAWLG